MRDRFAEQLSLLKHKLLELSALCETLIAKAAKALFSLDYKLAAEVAKDAETIERAEKEIELLCVNLLLRQQPVAKDLRQISSALKMVTDIRRIGEQAEEIAAIVSSLTATLADHRMLYRLALATIQQVTASIMAFSQEDISLAKEVIRKDTLVDEDFLAMKELLIKMIAEKPMAGGFALDLLLICKYFERIADHAVNIAQWVIYAVTGEAEGEVR